MLSGHTSLQDKGGARHLGKCVIGLLFAAAFFFSFSFYKPSPLKVKGCIFSCSASPPAIGRSHQADFLFLLATFVCECFTVSRPFWEADVCGSVRCCERWSHACRGATLITDATLFKRLPSWLTSAPLDLCSTKVWSWIGRAWRSSLQVRAWLWGALRFARISNWREKESKSCRVTDKNYEWETEKLGGLWCNGKKQTSDVGGGGSQGAHA